jgi:hypothetical protein
LHEAVATEDVTTSDDCNSGLGDEVGLEGAGRGGYDERFEADYADGWVVVERGCGADKREMVAIADWISSGGEHGHRI